MNSNTPVWGFARKFSFRFFFCFFILISTFWNYIPYFGKYLSPYQYIPSFAVQNYLLGWHDTPRWTRQVTGSGDTLDDFVLYATWAAFSLLIAVAWFIVDRKRPNYEQLEDYLKIGLRFYLAYVMFIYGIIKLLLMQMPYPNLAHFHMPLGEFTPMRFAWLFIGYSPGYQFVSGLFETLGAILLLFRRTYLLGALLLLGVLGNVVMLNYFYGVPAKLISSFLLLICLYLTFDNFKRLVQFFILNQRVDPVTVRHLPQVPWKRALYAALPFLFLIYAVYNNTSVNLPYWKMLQNKHYFEFYGSYDVIDATRNGMPLKSIGDTTLWTQIVVGEGYVPEFESGLIRQGASKVTIVGVQRDTTGIVRVRASGYPNPLFEGTVNKTDEDLFIWKGVIESDSVQFVARRSSRDLTLPSRSFKWILEQNEF